MDNRLSQRLPEKWEAKWIDPELPHDKKLRQPASVLRRSFQATRVSEARLYITCHGLYEAYLNGSRIGDFVLAPGVDDYRKRLQVQVYDVAPLLREGKNELLVTLGDGWYRGNNGIDGSHDLFGSDLALLCQLEADGKTLLASDEQWEASQEGPIRLNDMELGELYDARREAITSWHPVTVRNYGFKNLVPTDTVIIKEQERFSGKILHTPNGETVIDYGQNLAGYTEMRVMAKAGQRIVLWHGETLDENGNFTQSNYDPGARNKNGGIPQRLEYICKDGLNLYKPHFSIFGFRYAKVETDIDLSNAEFTSFAVYSDMKQTGWFECGNADVNQLFHNSLWSMRSNFCDIPTDCPTRERAGWTGDAGVFAPTAVYLMDCYPVLRKWLAECRLAQEKNGKVVNIAPPNNSSGLIAKIINGSAGWGDACVLVPWALYEAYGRKEILEENYEMMTRWLAFCERRARKTRRKNRSNPYHRYLVDNGFHFGEWLEPDVPSMDAMRRSMSEGAPEVATAYLFRSASLVSQIADILGKPQDAAKYAALAGNAHKAYRYSLTDNGVITSDRQCAYVRPIAFGLLEGDEAQAAADALDDLVRQNHYRLNTGFLSTPDLCRVLADHGHADTAYKLLLQDTCPGWLYAVKKGATTIWETWDGIREDGTVHDSLNHYSYGAIAGWLFAGVCGIRLSAGKLTIRPCCDPSLGYAKAVWDSPRGRIQSAWRFTDGRLLFDITVPENLEAVICLPDGRTEPVGAGTHHFES
ncbi:MAG: family 78 glycoside hydrolase catalytic domain [Firmicutes bacterium]|nr:family 78 glycoside hydrolase catalytic domain [Bacillota bacterium]